MQPVIQLKDGAGGDMAKSGVTITAALTDASGTLEGDLSETTDAAGARASPISPSPATDGNYTITFTAPDSSR